MHSAPVHQAAWRDSDTGARTAASKPPLAYGALASICKDNLYWFSRRGFIFTSPWVVTPSTLRPAGVVLLTASGEPFELTVGNCVLRRNAVAIAPLIRRGLVAVDVGLVSVNVDLRHPWFGAFRSIAAPGLVSLDRRQFSHFDTDLIRAYEGRLTFEEGRRLFEHLVETAARQLPRQKRHDPRADHLHEFIRENPTCSLDELARDLNLSYTGASHLFSRAIGVPFRSYQQWLKAVRAAEKFDLQGRLTAIAHMAGFSDSAHFSRTWQRNYGLSPTYVRNGRQVRVFT